ncbi:hypothetical protein PIB30_073611 [Stylosanthes scabra]|uniref:Uncharacterized protein n=1 Tax=Stylosanthes scabra TaxID=79078 RepID=A0ABU6QQL9_9FABA|nr:hypothetical protein [Stylosanthes scabra]
MRRSSRLHSGQCSRPSVAPQQMEVVDIEDDLTDFPLESTPNPIETPNPIAIPPRIPEYPPQTLQRTPKSMVKKRARKTPTKKTTTTIPENQVETEPEPQIQTFLETLCDNEPQNHNTGPAEVQEHAGGDNASQSEPSNRQNQRKRKASYKRPVPTGQAIVQGGKGEAPKIFVPHVNSHASSGEESDYSDNHL